MKIWFLQVSIERIDSLDSTNLVWLRLIHMWRSLTLVAVALTTKAWTFANGFEAMGTLKKVEIGTKTVINGVMTVGSSSCSLVHWHKL